MPTYPQAGLAGKRPADLAWLTGSWYAEIDNDQIEEHWSSLRGGTLMAMFRWIRDSSVLFYEIEVIEQDADLVYLRVKHFDPKLVGWEEKGSPHEFLLVELNQRGAVFLELGKPRQRWAVYEREGPNKLRAYFTHDREPDLHPGVFEFERKQ
jgi:hypothetical protein